MRRAPFFPSSVSPSAALSPTLKGFLAPAQRAFASTPPSGFCSFFRSACLCLTDGPGHSEPVPVLGPLARASPKARFPPEPRPASSLPFLSGFALMVVIVPGRGAAPRLEGSRAFRLDSGSGDRHDSWSISQSALPDSSSKHGRFLALSSLLEEGTPTFGNFHLSFGCSAHLPNHVLS